MSQYRPRLDDDRLVSEALSALAQETGHLEAPPAVERRLRESFRDATVPTAVPPSPTHPWTWITALAAAAGLAWLAIGSLQPEPQPPAVGPEAHAAAPAPPPAPPSPALTGVEEPKLPPAMVPAVRRAAAAAPGALRSRRTRPAPVPEHFEALYPGDPLADLDAVHLVRVSVPRSALATLGWPARMDPGGRDPIELDAMVGPDGVARAVRFVRP